MELMCNVIGMRRERGDAKTCPDNDKATQINNNNKATQRHAVSCISGVPANHSAEHQETPKSKHVHTTNSRRNKQSLLLSLQCLAAFFVSIRVL